MGSLNGDTMVVRNGRSTSQVSIYNYPEHLNPFYEDDQHKRLRFWKISKKDNEGRRNSFSIGNLKDMWAFKSFRMKKKSSTLGINKTSESPPTLRRGFVIDNGWNTFDHRLRGSNVTSLNGDNFERNATYRSSLQTLPTSNSDRIGLNRNDGYRSTIQVTRSSPRYQPKLQQQQQSTGVSPNLRSSQSSMASTNPFESDDEENEDINSSGVRSVNIGSTTTLTSRTPRKKRRAPVPPSPMHNRSNTASPPTIVIESSHGGTNDELRIKEDIDIANLTAEIQSFVETTNNDDVEISQEPKDSRVIAERTTITNRENAEAPEVEINTNSTAITSANGEVPVTSEIRSTLGNCTKTRQSSKDEEATKPTLKTNQQITTETVTVTTPRKAKATKSLPERNKPSETETDSAAIVAKFIETEINESKENKINGAMPKKPNNITDTSLPADQQQSISKVVDLFIKEETKGENMPQKPLPVKRQTKPVPEVGHVECIHVHVESPKPPPRKEPQSGISSFKISEPLDSTEIITTKTPFVLTSPPTNRKEFQPHVETTQSTIKETVRIIKPPNENRISELNINEEQHINAKPEILVKPTISPKPILKEPHVKAHEFAEIHKPMRSKYSKNQNGHVRTIARDDSVSPPTLPLEKAEEDMEEKKINNLTFTQIESTEIKSGERKENQLKIVEDKHNQNQPVKGNSESLVTSGRDNFKREDEFDMLYRPKPASHMEWKRSTLAPLETNIPPEKRKSVKDIIESINRSQRLLNAAANKDFITISDTSMNRTSNGSVLNSTQTTTISATTNSHMDENLRILDERQREIQRLVAEIDQTVENTNLAAAVSLSSSLSPSPSPSNYNNENADAQKLDNSEIFKKCKVKKEVYDYRESSPISSNLDWNPLPKPRRTKSDQD